MKLTYCIPETEKLRFILSQFLLDNSKIDSGTDPEGFIGTDEEW